MRVQRFRELIGQLLCRVGFHDFRVVEVDFDFAGRSVEHLECQRCGQAMVRGL